MTPCQDCHFYRKTTRFKVFQFEISNRMGYWLALYDSFENLHKMSFQLESRNSNCLCGHQKNQFFEKNIPIRIDG